MSTEITRLKNRNVIMFPRELRDAIPDLPTYTGRVLELESIDGSVVDTPWSGPQVNVKMVVTETGRLKGKFVVRLACNPAPRALSRKL